MISSQTLFDVRRESARQFSPHRAAEPWLPTAYPSDIAPPPTVTLQFHDIDLPLTSEKELVIRVDPSDADVPLHR
jgi:hypothetical protein